MKPREEMAAEHARWIALSGAVLACLRGSNGSEAAVVLSMAVGRHFAARWPHVSKVDAWQEFTAMARLFFDGGHDEERQRRGARLGVIEFSSGDGSQ